VESGGREKLRGGVRDATPFAAKGEIFFLFSFASSVGKNGADKFNIINLARARVDSLQKLIDLFVGHFLAEIGENVT